MPNDNKFLDQEIFNELLRRSTAPAHEPVSDADVVRTQIADLETRRRAGESMPGMPPVDTPIDVMLGILPIGSPIRNPKARAAIHEVLKKSVGQMPSQIQAGVHEFIKKYPRLTSHLKTITPQNPADKTSATMASLPRPPLAPQARIELNPSLVSQAATRRSLQHEGTHVAQMLRLMDRTRHANPARASQPSSIFSETYNDLSKQVGYHDNPMEVAARMNRELLELPRQTVGRRGIAQERAMDKVRQDVNLARDLGQQSRHSDREMVDELIRHATQTGKIPPSGQRRFTEVDTLPISVGSGELGPMPQSITVPKSMRIQPIETPASGGPVTDDEVMALIRQVLGK